MERDEIWTLKIWNTVFSSWPIQPKIKDIWYHGKIFVTLKIYSLERDENADVAQNMKLDGMILKSEEKGRGETHSDRGSKTTWWTSSGAQCLRIHLPMQGMWVWLLVRELRYHMLQKQLSPRTASTEPLYSRAQMPQLEDLCAQCNILHDAVKIKDPTCCK